MSFDNELRMANKIVDLEEELAALKNPPVIRCPHAALQFAQAMAPMTQDKRDRICRLRLTPAEAALINILRAQNCRHTGYWVDA